ncbi:hypothetical protein [uncultured Legionella sp.]|uniref:hypothetical protein n=1 Tax=uncultured Legionella sp. TaxID=210934 RepID=UPI00260D193A|nr:hypothetical protein [uncultured Legionella sp.]
MDELVEDEQLSKWFSTYGLITAERILGKYHIALPQTELISAVKSSFSFYHLLLKIPLKNVLNGIVLQQAGDYHIYAQKLFIDYLLSGESSKSEDSPGALTRESMEMERQKLVTLGEDYHQLQLDQNELIASSQISLIKTAELWKKNFEALIGPINATIREAGFDVSKSVIRSGINNALIHCDYVHAASLGNEHLFIDEFNKVVNIKLTDDLKNKLLGHLAAILEILLNFESEFGVFMKKNKELGEVAKSYRTQFYDAILRINELISLLPDYKINPEQDAINRESLYFDNTIGDN